MPQVITAQPGPQTDFLSCPADICVFGGSAGGGKAVKLLTLIPTPFGYVTMGEIQVGDQVFDENGVPCNVIAKSEVFTDHVCYELTFDDGTTIVVDASHEWKTMTDKERTEAQRRTPEHLAKRCASRPSHSAGKKPWLAELNRTRECTYKEPPTGKIRTTQEIAETLLYRGYRRNHSIDVCKPAQYPHQDLPIDPYLLGVWLGDGTAIFGDYSKPNVGIAEKLRERGFAVIEKSASHGCPRWKVEGLLPLLKQSNLFNNKHIPEIYLRGSVEQRLDLIRGLMDTDGHCSPEGKIEFCNTNKNIADGLLELVRSLGIKATMREGRAKFQGKDYGTKYRIQFVTDIPVFYLERKRQNQRMEIRDTLRRRYIVSCKRVPTVPTQCITVDSPSHLYLVTESYIPTHNSYSLLLDPLRFIHHSHFSAVVFRRTNPEIVNPGGLWDEAMQIYPGLGAEATKHNLTFRFPSGATIKLAHLQYDQDMYSWQGSQICYIGWDELTHFSAAVFWYLFSRQRNPYGIPSLIRATCNPDPDSFVADLISWWIDEKTGFPIKERSGIIRWFVRVNDALIWDDKKETLEQNFPKLIPKSFTFIPSSLKDNKILMDMDANYEANLLALPTVERERLLNGNWKIRATAGLYFKRSYFEVIDKENLPILQVTTRGWDLAASPDPKIEKAKAKKEPDSTAGVLMGKDKHGHYYVIDLIYGMFTPAVINKLLLDAARKDGKKTIIRIPQDPGQAGKFQVYHFAKLLVGYIFRTRTMTGDKVTRAGAFSSACENGLVSVVRGTWNDLFFSHLEGFPPEQGSPDIVDACVEAFDELTKSGRGLIVKPISIKVDDND